MLEDVILPVDFGGGLDTKTDPKKTVKGKFLMTENGVYTKIDRIQKRNGYDALPSAIVGGSSIVAPRMLKSYGNELLAADQGSLLSYSPSQSEWVNKGSYVSAALSRTSVDQQHPTSGFVDSATLGNYTVYAWLTTASGTGDLGAFASIVDNQTNTIVLGPRIIQSTNPARTGIRCVVMGGNKIGIFLDNNSGNIFLYLVTLTSGSIAIANAIQLTTDDYNQQSFDVIGTAAGATVAYTNTAFAQISIINVNTSGTITATRTVADGPDLKGMLQLALDSGTGDVWLYYLDYVTAAGPPVHNTSATVKYAVFSSALAVVLTSTSILALASPYYITNMTALPVNATSQTVFFGQLISDGVSAYVDVTYSTTVTVTGTVPVPSSFVQGVTPFSRPTQVTSPSGTNTYMVAVYRGIFPSTDGGGFRIFTPTIQIQPTYFLIDCSTAKVVGRFASGDAGTQVSQGLFRTDGQIWFVPNLTLKSTSVLRYACGVSIQQLPASSSFAAVTDSSGFINSTYSYDFDFNNANAFSAVLAGNCFVMNGAALSLYDGNSSTEWGFHLQPEILEAPITSTTGRIGVGTYSYIAIFQWVDEQGGQHQSATSVPVSVTTTSGTGSIVTAYITNAFLTQKTTVIAALFRTKTGGSIYYQVSDPIFINRAEPNSHNTVYVTIQDNLSDADIAGNFVAYTYPGSQVLTNSTPPPSNILAAHNNRLFFVNAEEPNTYWYTKTFQPLVGLSPSGFLNQQIDPKEGPIQALAEMDANLVGFKSQGIFLQAGDGAGDTGAGGNLSTPSFIPSAVGCTNPKSVRLTPKGLMFQSESGIYLLDRALGVHYADQYFNGSAVEGFNGQTYTDARIIPGTSQIRILTASGYSLVYDYIFDKWASFTNHLGYSSDIWNGAYVYLRTDGGIYKENTAGTYLDSSTAYSLRAQTSWLVLSTVQNFQRARILELLGDSIGSTGHGVQMSVAYDFVQSFSTPVAYSIPAAASSTPYQYRQFPTQQKCDSLSILIEEVTTGASGEYLDLTNLSILAGIKKGIYKLPAASSVG